MNQLNGNEKKTACTTTKCIKIGFIINLLQTFTLNHGSPNSMNGWHDDQNPFSIHPGAHEASHLQTPFVQQPIDRKKKKTKNLFRRYGCLY